MDVLLFLVALTGSLLSVDTSASQACLSGHFDTITRTSDGFTYAFKGELVIRIVENGNGIAFGYPKPICAVFAGLPSNLDASVFWPETGKTYFFKGTRYWRTSGTSLDDSYPKTIYDNFGGAPSNLDAALSYGDSGFIYFFKGDQYWRFDVEQKALSMPANIQAGWNGLSSPLDAAFQWDNGRSYLFIGGEYWKYNERGYPLATSRHWLGCQDGDQETEWTDVWNVWKADPCAMNSECLSGHFDTITRTSDENTYAFKDGLVIRLVDNGNGIASGYPKPICAVFAGLPSTLDASVFWPESGKTYFFKGTRYWRTSGTSLDDGYPKTIYDNFGGAPSNLDAALLYGDSGFIYFFKGDQSWRYDMDQNVLSMPTNTQAEWSGLGSPLDAAFQWNNGRSYLFIGGEYWKYNEREIRLESGYPLATGRHWLGCRDGDHETEWTNVCNADLCSTNLASRCLHSRFDAIAHIDTGMTMGNIFAFRGEMVTKLTPSTGDIVSGYPKQICSVFTGLPSNIDAALSCKGMKQTYFFKGALCYRFTVYRLDQGYPKTITEAFPGVPSDIDAAVAMDDRDDGRFYYFFKGRGYYKFDRRIGRVPVGYPAFIRSDWPGLPGDIDAALQWINGWTYFFKDEQFYRWDFVKNKVARMYPRSTDSVWLGCTPLDERNECWVPQCM